MSDVLAFFATWFVCGIVSIRPFVLTDKNLKAAEKEGKQLPLKYFANMFFNVTIGGGLSFLVAAYLVASVPHITLNHHGFFLRDNNEEKNKNKNN